MDLADHLERLKANDNLKFSQEYEVSVRNVDLAIVINVTARVLWHIYKMYSMHQVPT